jgi:hypothetical protein
MLVCVLVTRRKEKGKMDLRVIGCGNEKLMEIGCRSMRVSEPLGSITRGLFSRLIKLLHSVVYNR